MNEPKVDSILELYKQMETVFSGFQKENRLSCPEGCGACCLSPEIEASVAEMLPLAHYLIKTNKAIETLNDLEDSSRTCVLYQSQTANGEKGYCKAYEYRPAICRMFGVAGASSKDSTTKYSICSKLKQERMREIEDLELRKPEAPFMHEWIHKLLSIDPEVLQQRYPINQALKEALLKLLYIHDLSKNSLVTLST
jgi:Fe-S-cluster containining protein